MNCLQPTYIKSPETRLLRKCLFEGKSFEYYWKHSHARRNVYLDPVALVNNPDEYYHLKDLPERVQRVPCGKCTNCIKRKVNDYFVRNYYEWIKARARGCTYFITLTYADDILPRLDDGTPCFDSRHISLFIKRLQKNMELKGLRPDFKYFIVAEYGGELGRPHYHGFLHLYDVPNTISNQWIVKELVAKSWTKKDDRKEWHANKEMDLFDMQRIDCQPLGDIAGIRYVSKYIGKQIGAEQFDNRTDVEARFRRGHWQSLGLGDCLTQYVDPEQFREGLVTIDGFKYALPNYFLIKLRREFYCYSDNGTIIYQPTAFARDSAQEFTLARLQEYKDLSVLNEGFPVASPLLYDANNLALLEEYLKRYNGFTLSQDFSAVDPCRSDEVELIIDAVREFFDAVDEWYKPKYKGSAMLYEKHQQDRFLKKIGMK